MLRPAITILGSLALLAVGSVFLFLCAGSSGMSVVRPRVNIQKHYVITNVPEIAPLGALVEQFLASRTANPHTRTAYKNSLAYFSQFCAAQQVKQYADISRQLITDFQASREILEKPSTVRLRFDVVKAFCRWMQERYFIYDPSKGVDRNVVDEDEAYKALTDEEYRLLVRSALAQKDPLRRFVPLLLVESGLRCFEATGLKLGQISEDGLWFRYVVGKRKKKRHVPITPVLAPELQTFLMWRRTLPMAKDQPLLPSSRGLTSRTAQPIGNKTVWRIMSSVAKTNPHSCRHTFAYRTRDRLLKEYGDAGLNAAEALSRTTEVLMTVMGHTSWETTMKYLQIQKSNFETAFHGGIEA